MSVDAKKTKALDLCGTPQHTSLLEEVFFNADILGSIVEHLYRPDATRLSAVCGTIRALLKTHKMNHRPRLLVLAANCLSYMDMLTGRELQRTALQLPGCGDVQNLASIVMKGPYKHTCLAIHGKHIHVCCQKPPRCTGNDYVQPRPTVRRYSTNDLSFAGTTAKLQEIEDEDEDELEIEVEEACMGLAFSKGCMYIATLPGHIRRIAPHPDGQSFQSPNPHGSPEYPSSPDNLCKVPSVGDSLWGARPQCMATGPDGNLYILTQEDCEGDDGHLLHRKTRSYIVVGILGATGAILSMKPFCGLSDSLVQSSMMSGLCFDDQGNLYVTCMTRGVLQYTGPLADNPGQFMRVAAQWTDYCFPHDVKWHKGIKGIGGRTEPLLLVVRQHGQQESRLAVFSAVSGQLLKELSFPHEQDILANHMSSMKYILVD